MGYEWRGSAQRAAHLHNRVPVWEPGYSLVSPSSVVGEESTGRANRTPGWLPFVNWTPPCSSASLSVRTVILSGAFFPDSKLWIVVRVTPERDARSSNVHPSRARAARHWSFVTEETYHADLEARGGVRRCSAALRLV